MGSSFLLALCLGMLALCFASPINNIRWCVKTNLEMKKCEDLSRTCPSGGMTLSCVLRVSADDCCKAIAEGAADAITLDSGEVYKCSLYPYKLKPVAAENYGTEKVPDTCYYAVALVSKSSDFQFKDLKGKKSCHTAVGRSAGWNAPIGLMLAQKIFSWEGSDIESIEKAVARVFSASCAPGAKDPNLCKQCIGVGDKKCKASEVEPYFGYGGAYKCLADDKGEVAFVKHILPDDANKNFELLCPDNTRKSVMEYKDCFISRIPGHAVVTEDKEEKIKAVTKFLEEAQKKKECELFSSSHGKDLVFKSSAKSLQPVPEKMDAFLYLGSKFAKASKALHAVVTDPPEDTIRWCTQSTEEKTKCDNWGGNSGGEIECIDASNAEECITKVMKGEADAVTLDSGYLYTAGECGLIPVMQEIYDAEACNQRKVVKGSYYAVAVAKKDDKDITWKSLRDTMSCHTGLGRTAGHIIPAGLIRHDTGVCDLSKFFKKSCMPGADPNSNLCSLCAGNPEKSKNTKCFANNQELYYGYDGALRCLFEGGNVAFIKHSTVKDILEGKNRPEWAKNWQKEDLVLLCPDGTRKSIDEYEKCHLALVPPHAVATTPDRKEAVGRILKKQEERFGIKGQDRELFQMFVSEGAKDQLFKDSTRCLSDVKESNMKDFLGQEYYNSISALNECGKSGLLAACTFHTCKV